MLKQNEMQGAAQIKNELRKRGRKAQLRIVSRTPPLRTAAYGIYFIIEIGDLHGLPYTSTTTNVQFISVPVFVRRFWACHQSLKVSPR